MKRTTLALLCLLSCAAARATEGWIDITDQYITNPCYDNSSNAGWTISANASSTNCAYGCQEFWNGTFNIYQTLNLSAGTYRLTVNAFYRTGDYGSLSTYATVPAKMYAGSTTQTIVNVLTEYLSENYASQCATNTTYLSSSKYYPNTMYAANYCFGLGMYVNQMTFTHSGGSLAIGMKTETSTSSNWCIMDNWVLEYYGEVTNVTSITLSDTELNLSMDEDYQLTFSVLPDDASYKKVTWTSSNESVCTVATDGTVTAVGLGTCTITATAYDGGGATATCKVTVADNSSYLTKLYITEVQTSNIDQTIDPSWNFGAWIELYNPTAYGVSLKSCWLSDDASNLMQVHLNEVITVPAYGRRCIWFDHYDKYCPTLADMKLDNEGGSIYPSSPDGALISSLTYPEGVARCSYAMKDDGTWGLTSTPTPEEANAGGWATQRLEAPEVDKDSQVFGTAITVCVNIPQGATLRYTTDGSTPTLANGLTSSTGLFSVDATTTYRFCLFQDGYLPSAVVTRSYIYESRTHGLPVMSIVTDADNLYGEEYGIFVQGSGNGRPGNGQSSACNWNMDWQRPMNVELLNTEGEMVVNQETGMERCGGWSRAWTPYSFKIRANKQYELQSYMPYEFFPDRPYLKHKALQMRNGGNDYTCRIKDAALAEIIYRSGIDVENQAYQPVMHYINGQYAGVLNMREPNNKHYVYAHYGLDGDEIDFFEMSPDSGYVQKSGTYDALQQWYTLSSSAASEDIYEQIKQIVDIDEFCNYMAIEFFLGNTDWPQNNVKAWKPIMDGGKFRFIMFDLDFAFGTTSPFSTFAGKQTRTFDLLYGQDVDYITKEIELVTIFLNMLSNDDFRKQFIDTYCLVVGSVFEPTRCEEIITELANAVSTYQQLSTELYYSSSPWSTAQTLIYKLTANYQTTMLNALKNYSAMGLSSQTGQSIPLSTDCDQARLFVNDLPVPTNKFSGTLYSPITLKAQAPAGYRFEGWKKVTGTTTSDIEIFSKGSTWLYNEEDLDGTDWKSEDYDDDDWTSGTAPLGYGQSDVSTTLTSYLTTYYFRKQFWIDQTPTSADAFSLAYVVDDGYVIYINGQEVDRDNMPSGTITNSTSSSTYALNNPNSGTLPIDYSYFHKGTNTIAVEVHNYTGNGKSSDIEWDASLTWTLTNSNGTIVATTEEYTIPTSGDFEYQATYEEMTDDEKQEAGLSTAPIVINEVSAGNSVNVNDYWKKDDWIELYNTTDTDIDLAGMYLTDNAKKPTKYQITAEGTKASTIIEAHGYKIIWCSKRDTYKELHASFKLDNEDGAMVRIQAADGSWADSLYYCAMDGDQTCGRFPDGGNQLYLMTLTTIAATNRISTYASEWDYEAPEEEEEVVTPDEPDTEDEEEEVTEPETEQEEPVYNGILNARSGGLSLACVGDWLLIKSEETDAVQLTIYNAAGATVMNANVTMELMHARVSVASLPTGVYVATIVDADGERCATKLVRP